MPLLDRSKLEFREMEGDEAEIVWEMLEDGSREMETRLMLFAMTRPAALLLMAVASSALRLALSSFAAALVVPVACFAVLLKLGLLLRRLRDSRGRRGEPGNLWVAVHDGEDVCGCLTFDPWLGDGRSGGSSSPPATVELRGLAVSRWHRRSGVGTFLLAAFEAGARTRGHRRVSLRVAAVNRAAIALFQKQGYRLSGTGGGRLCSSLTLEYAKDL
uniref:probable N-acetyltransferase 14 n=1 Tax=Pristiophorus japonicus TaxID=55135 RepID=UPI00398F8D35